MNTFKRRWYDKDQELAFLIESLNFIGEEKVEEIMRQIKKIIDDDKSTLINVDFGSNLGEFLMRRRWYDKNYDKNPYTGLIINELKNVSSELLNKVKIYLIEYFKLKMT